MESTKPDEEYLLQCKANLKLLQKRLALAEQDGKKWLDRADLAQKAGKLELAAAARTQAADSRAKAEKLQSDITELKSDPALLNVEFEKLENETSADEALRSLKQKLGLS